MQLAGIRLMIAIIAGGGFLAGTSAMSAEALYPFALTSPAFQENGTIPQKYTCDGQGISPPLAWSGAPAATRSFALVVRDPDAPRGSFVHWVIFNLPPSLGGLPAAVPAAAVLPNGAVQGVNGTGNTGYKGPCPPPGPVHHYHFHLIALDSVLDLKPGADAAEVEQAASSHAVGIAELTGLFGH
jgi:Raf kinase inhibitor-like YbhB/YbcL family protein